MCMMERDMDEVITKVTARVPGTSQTFTLESAMEPDATRMLAFMRHRGFTEVLKIQEPTPKLLETWEGALWNVSGRD